MKSQEYLRKLQKAGLNLSLASFCRRFGFSPATVREWRRNIAGFRDAEDRIREHLATLPRHKPTEGKVYEEGLSDQEARFIRSFRDNNDHYVSMGIVGWDLDDLDAALRENATFKHLYNMARKEQQLRIDDQLRMSAEDGNQQALKLFASQAKAREENENPTKPAVITTADIEASRRRWQKMFGDVPPAEPPAAAEVN